MAHEPAPNSTPPIVPVADVPHAPFIYYEGVSAFGFTNGVINLTLVAGRTWIGPDGNVVNDHVVTAYLRGNVQAALNLKHAIDSALLLAAPTDQKQAS